MCSDEPATLTPKLKESTMNTPLAAARAASTKFASLTNAELIAVRDKLGWNTLASYAAQFNCYARPGLDWPLDSVPDALGDVLALLTDSVEQGFGIREAGADTFYFDECEDEDAVRADLADPAAIALMYEHVQLWHEFARRGADHRGECNECGSDFDKCHRDGDDDCHRYDDE
jgi:hypothetical protein